MPFPAVASPWFHYATGLLVLGNFVVMCLYLPGEATARSRALHIVELALAGVFLAECLVRILASGETSSQQGCKALYPSAQPPHSRQACFQVCSAISGTLGRCLTLSS